MPTFAARGSTVASMLAAVVSAACGREKSLNKSDAQRLIATYVRDSLKRDVVVVDSLPVFKPVDTTRADGKLARSLYGAEHVASFAWHDPQRHGTGTAGFKRDAASDGWVFAIKPELEVIP
jgi:hypothetical protein